MIGKYLSRLIASLKKPLVVNNPEIGFDNGVVHVENVGGFVLNTSGGETELRIIDVLYDAQKSYTPGEEGFRFVSRGDTHTYRFGDIAGADFFCSLLDAKGVEYERHNTRDYRGIIGESFKLRGRESDLEEIA